MGHTILPMRWVIYEKMEQIRKLIKGLREPHKSIAEELIDNVFQNISAINYSNPLPAEIENDMVFSILLQEKIKGDSQIDDLTIILLSLMITYKKNKLDNPHESNIYRLLCKG